MTIAPAARAFILALMIQNVSEFTITPYSGQNGPPRHLLNSFAKCAIRIRAIRLLSHFNKKCEPPSDQTGAS